MLSFSLPKVEIPKLKSPSFLRCSLQRNIDTFHNGDAGSIALVVALRVTSSTMQNMTDATTHVPSSSRKRRNDKAPTLSAGGHSLLRGCVKADEEQREQK